MRIILKASLAIIVGAALLKVASFSKDDEDKKKSLTSSGKKAKFPNKDFMLSDYNIAINSSMFSLFLN